MTTVDLTTRTAVRDGVAIVKDGMAVNGYQIRESPVTFSELERLYAVYKTSVPDRRRPRRSYFKAKTYREMSDQEMLNGANRQRAREALEMALLEGVLNGSLTWPDPQKWFWQSKADKDFVILREWIVGREGGGAVVADAKA